MTDKRLRWELEVKLADKIRDNLYEGDCKELLKSIASETIQLVVTSPPYNIGKKIRKET